MRVEKEIHDKIEEGVKERLRGKVDLQLGKKGITKQFVNELAFRLKKHGVVKVRVLKSFLRASEVEVEDLARQLASMVGGRVRDVRGHTFIIIRGPPSGPAGPATAREEAR